MTIKVAIDPGVVPGGLTAKWRGSLVGRAKVVGPAPSPRSTSPCPTNCSRRVQRVAPKQLHVSNTWTLQFVLARRQGQPCCNGGGEEAAPPPPSPLTRRTSSPPRGGVSGGGAAPGWRAAKPRWKGRRRGWGGRRPAQREDGVLIAAAVATLPARSAPPPPPPRRRRAGRPTPTSELGQRRPGGRESRPNADVQHPQRVGGERGATAGGPWRMTGFPRGRGSGAGAPRRPLLPILSHAPSVRRPSPVGPLPPPPAEANGQHGRAATAEHRSSGGRRRAFPPPCDRLRRVSVRGRCSLDCARTAPHLFLGSNCTRHSPPPPPLPVREMCWTGTRPGVLCPPPGCCGQAASTARTYRQTPHATRQRPPTPISPSTPPTRQPRTRRHRLAGGAGERRHNGP